MGLYETFIIIISEQMINIITTMGVSFFFFILTTWGLEKYLKTAEIERKIRAKENILDLLESSLIFKQDINPKKILHLVNAVGREHELDIFSYLTIINLLEELELRFEKSKHLDPTKKKEYTRKIEDLISELENEEENLEIPITYNKLLEELTKNIKNSVKTSALKNIDILKNKLIYRPYDSSFSIISNLSNIRRSYLLYILLIYLIIIFI